jgi:hypothetical protein
MVNNFIEEVASKTNEELREISVNFYMYLGSLVPSAKQELTPAGVSNACWYNFPHWRITRYLMEYNKHYEN